MPARKCPLCGKSFPDRSALRKHVQKVHPEKFGVYYPVKPRRPKTMDDAMQVLMQAGSTAKRPKAKKSRGANKVGSAERMRTAGRGLIGTYAIKVTTSSSTEAGMTLASLWVNPRELDPRGAAEAAFWVNWRPISLKFRATSSAASNISGRWAMAWSRDLNHRDLTPQQMHAAVLGTRSMAQGHIYQELSLTPPVQMTRQWYYTSGEEEEETTHGRLFIVSLGAISGLVGTINIDVTAEWTFEYMGRSLDLPQVHVGNAVTADAGWGPLFVTSTSAWGGGKKPVFKGTPGGGVAVFSRARKDVVYKLATDNKVYKDLKGTVQYTHFVRVKDYYIPTFTCFTDKTTAHAYAKTGDMSQIPDQTEASKWATPDILEFEPEVSLGQPRDEMAELRAEVANLRDAVLALRLGGPTASNASFQ